MVLKSYRHVGGSLKQQNLGIHVMETSGWYDMEHASLFTYLFVKVHILQNMLQPSLPTN